MGATTNSNVYGLGLAGGKGARLWPISHKGHEKQFCLMSQDTTFLQGTAKRLFRVGISPNNFFAATSDDNQTKNAVEQLGSLEVIESNILQIPQAYRYTGTMIEGAKYIYNLDPEAIIVNTPCDHYVDERNNFDSFIDSIKIAIQYAEAGEPTIVGVRVSDLSAYMGCGHALFDPNEQSICKTVTGFVEKPNKKTAKKMMRERNNICNTGINVWKAKTLLEATEGINHKSENFGTSELMSLFPHLRVAIGEFHWRDCGTLKSLWDISEKTPNHSNVSLGGGYNHQNSCNKSLSYSTDGIELYTRDIKDGSVVAIPKEDGIIQLACVRHDECQHVRELAEYFESKVKILGRNYSVKASNNRIVPSNFSDYLQVGIVGYNNLRIDSLRRPNGNVAIYVSPEESKVTP